MKKLSLLCAVVATLALSACGSGKSSYEAPAGAGGGVTTPPAAMVDAFYTTVLQYLSQTGEDTDASPIDDAVIATQPEDTEPTEFT